MMICSYIAVKFRHSMATWLKRSDQHCDFTKLSVPWVERTHLWNPRWENQAPAPTSSTYYRNNSYSSSSARVSVTHPKHCFVGFGDWVLDCTNLACSFLSFEYDDYDLDVLFDFATLCDFLRPCSSSRRSSLICDCYLKLSSGELERGFLGW